MAKTITIDISKPLKEREIIGEKSIVQLEHKFDEITISNLPDENEVNYIFREKNKNNPVYYLIHRPIGDTTRYRNVKMHIGRQNDLREAIFSGKDYVGELCILKYEFMNNFGNIVFPERPKDAPKPQKKINPLISLDIPDRFFDDYADNIYELERLI